MLREPRTADVIEGIIDVEFNRNHVPTSLLKTNANNFVSNYNSNTIAVPTTNNSSLMANMVKEKMTQNLIAAAYGNLAASISTNNTLLTPTTTTNNNNNINNNNNDNLFIPCVASTSSLIMPSISDTILTTTSDNCRQIAAATLVSNMIDVISGSTSINTTINNSNTISELPSFQFSSTSSNLSKN